MDIGCKIYFSLIEQELKYVGLLILLLLNHDGLPYVEITTSIKFTKQK